MSTPPPTTIRRVSERRTVIQSPGSWSARPRTARDHPERAYAQEPTMAPLGVNLEALASLQADELINLIESLRFLAAARTAEEAPAPPAPTQPTAPQIPTTTAGEDKAIIWEQVGTDLVPTLEVPPHRPPPPVDPTQGQTREDTANPHYLPPLPPLSLKVQGPPRSASTSAETCSNQRVTNSLAAYPTIFDLLRDDGTAQPAERMNILAHLPL